MSSFSHVQIAYFRRLYDTYRSKSAGINHNDLVLILRHLGPDIPLAVAKLKIRDYSKSGDFIKFDDFCRLLAAYQNELPDLQMEFVKALQYFLKKRTKAMTFGITEGNGLNRNDLINILLSGSQPLSITEANAAVDDILAGHTTISTKRILKKINHNGALWASISYDHKYISYPPKIMLKICLTEISDLSMLRRVKFRPGQGIAFNALDPFIRIRFCNSVLTTTIRQAESGNFWPRTLMLPIQIPSVSLDYIQSKIGFRNSVIIDLMDSQRTSRSSVYAEWIGSGRLRLTTVMRQSIGVVPYEVSFDCQNSSSNLRLRLTIELIGPSLGSIFDSIDDLILTNHYVKLAKDVNPAPAKPLAGKREVTLPGSIKTATIATKDGHSKNLLDRVIQIYERVEAQVPRRNVRLFGRDYNDNFALIVQFVTKCQIPPSYQNPQKLAESFCFLKGNPAHSCEPENTELDADIVLPPDFFIRRGFVSMLDRSLFLCGLFNACGLNAYVVTGNDGLYECVWVIDIDQNGTVRHWDTLTGKYSYSSSYVPGAVWNSRQFYFNVCSDDRPDLDWNLSDMSSWKPLLLETDVLPSRYRYNLVMTPMQLSNDSTSTNLIVAGIQSYRQARLGLTTPFYWPICEAFHSLLSSTDLTTVMTNRYLQDYARQHLFPNTLSSFRQIVFKYTGS